jgi:hypothetical protein
MDENYFSLFPEKRVVALEKVQKIIDNTEKLCEHLNTDYCNETLRISSRLISSGIDVEKNEKLISDINSGNYLKFRYDQGKKYYKVVQDAYDGTTNTHCFIDMENGNLYKPASQTSPYKDRVYDLENSISIADWRGNYLRLYDVTD